MENLNGKADLQNLIPQVWSTKFYEKLKNQLILASLFSRDYEGEIANIGDTVKVNQLSLAPAQTITNDKDKFDFTKISVNQFVLTINRQTIHAVQITDLAKLQSYEFMMELMKEMTYEIMVKMEQEIMDYYKAKFTNTASPAVSSDLDAKDVGKFRTTLSRAKVPLADTHLVLSPEYYGDLLNKNQVISSEFVDGRPLLEQKVPSLNQFKVYEHNLLPIDTGMAFHRSALQLAMQKGLSLKIVDMTSTGSLSYAVVGSIVWDMKEFDINRGLYLKN